MAGPGGREAGRVSIRVLPDTSVFARSLKRYLERMEKTLRVEIPVSLDEKGAGEQAERIRKNIERKAATMRVKAETAKAKEEIDRAAKDRDATIKVKIDKAQLQRVAKSLTSAVSGISRTAVVATALAGALGVAAQAAGALGGALATALVGVAALAPAVLLSAGVVAGVLVTAFKGFAGSSVPAVKQVNAAIDSLQKQAQRLQDALVAETFAGFGKEIRALGKTYLPVLDVRLRGVARSLNLMGLAFTGALRQAQSVADTNTGLRNLQASLRSAAAGVAPLVTAFRDLAVVGSSFLPELGSGFATAAKRFGEFIASARESGALEDFISGAFDAIAQLGTIVRDVGSIVKSVFTAMGTAGGDVLGVIGTLIGEMAKFAKSAQGQQFLVTVFQSLNAIGQALGPVFVALAGALGKIAPHLASVVQALAPGIAKIVDGLGTALDALGPALVDVAEALADALVGLAPALGPLAQAFAAIVEAATPILPLVGQIAATFAGVLASVLQALQPAISAIASALSSSLAPILPQLALSFQAIAVAIAPVAEDLGNALAQAIITLAPMIPTIVTSLANLAVSLSEILTQLTPLLPGLLTLALVILNKTTIELTLALVDALASLAGSFADLLKQLSGPIKSLGDFLTKVGELGSKVPSVSQIVSQTWDQLWQQTREAWDRVWGKIRDAWTNIRTSVSSAVSSLKTTISGWLTNARTTISEAWHNVWTKVKEAWTDIKTSVSEGVRNAIQKVKELPGKAVAALGNLGRKLYSSGRSLIQGFIDGIRSKIGDVTGAVSNVVSKARDYFPFSPAKKGPFSGRGWTLYSGYSISEALAKGIERKSHLVRSASNQLAAVAQPSFRGLAGAATVGAAGAAGATFNVYPSAGMDERMLAREALREAAWQGMIG